MELAEKASDPRHDVHSVVTLDGTVPSKESELAEFDAWYVFGVDAVATNLQLRR